MFTVKEFARYCYASNSRMWVNYITLSDLWSVITQTPHFNVAFKR